MFDKLYAALNGLTHYKQVLQNIENVLDMVDESYLKDGENSRNAAIDAIIEILQSHKVAR